jgi:LmbE family N-acetylglucosaminyl deacetylase
VTGAAATLVAMEHLGTVLMIWAHPDDETYLAGGLSAALSDAGQRVVCVTATRGAAGGDADVRGRELEAALRVLGVSEHHWLEYDDGDCASVDPTQAATRLGRLLDDVRPDTVITFGQDGFTGHPDHRAVNGWTDLAIAGARETPRLLHPVARPQPLDADLDENFNVFELGRPRTCSDDELALLLELDEELLDRKVEALLRQWSQTGGLVEAVGLERFRTWVSQEAFAEPPQTT